MENNNNIEKIKFSENIERFLERYFKDEDIYSMSLEELEDFKKRVIQKRQEYMLLEMGMKISSNAAYGASASPYFYFFNVALAADITGECRELTQTMWRNLNTFFRETIWERKDLWEQFNFELDENKREWAQTVEWSIYSDTDSVDNQSVIYFLTNKGSIQKLEIGKLYDKLSKFNPIIKTNSGHEMIEYPIKTFNFYYDKIQTTNIKRLIRHKVSKPKFKIKTKSGKEIVVTGDHSIIVFRNGEKMSIKAKDINIKTDKILSIKY